MYKDHTVVIDLDGTVRFVDNDDLIEFRRSMGPATIKRASHVEPELVDGEIRWFVDMSPVGGPKLPLFTPDGDKPGYATKQEALDVEERYLIDHDVPEPS